LTPEGGSVMIVLAGAARVTCWLLPAVAEDVEEAALNRRLATVGEWDDA
jgi:hypothetical protein